MDQDGEEKWLGWIDIVEREQKEAAAHAALVKDVRSAGVHYAFTLAPMFPQVSRDSRCSQRRPQLKQKSIRAPHLRLTTGRKGGPPGNLSRLGF